MLSGQQVQDSLMSPSRPYATQAKCIVNQNHPHDYSSLTNDKPCALLFFIFSLILVQEGEAKFSIGFGLILFFALQMVIFGIELAFRDADEGPQNWRAL